MSKFIAILYATYVVLYVAGCAYKGDVYLYSPQGDANAIEKAVSTDAEITLPLIP
jgi:hypothetical protein